MKQYATVMMMEMCMWTCRMGMTGAALFSEQVSIQENKDRG